MARPRDPGVTSIAVEDTKQRQHDRDRMKARYWSSEKARQAKIAAVERWRAENPERAKEVKNLAEKRRRRGIQRAYRKADA